MRRLAVAPLKRSMLVPMTLSILLTSAVDCTTHDDPNTPEYWIDKLDSKRERRDALKQLGKLGDQKALPEVLGWFKEEGEWQPEAAYALGQLGDKSTTKQLRAGLDFAVGTGRDKRTRLKNRINMNAARALAMLGAEEAVGDLIKLSDAAEPRVREAALRALGKLGSPEGTECLTDVALNGNEPFLRKVAVQALGDLGDVKAVPTLVQMLFREAPGVSFYNEARYSLIQVGDGAIAELIKTMQRKNSAVEEIRMADGGKIAEGAVEAKSAFVLGSLRAKDAEPLMIGALKRFYTMFKNREKVPVYASVPGAVIELCYALGNLGTPAATKALLPIAKDTNPGLRVAATEGLTAIGDSRAAPTLIEAAKTGDASARRAALTAASRLGDGKDLAAFDALAKVKPTDLMAKMVKTERVRLESAIECKRDLACWRGKIADSNERVRERAAYELGWLGDKKALPELLKAAEDSDAMVRMAAVLSIGRLGEADTGRLQAIHDQWKTKLEYAGVNHELKFLIARLSSQKSGKN